MLVFEEDNIVLDLPAGSAELKVVDGWRIRPLTYPQVKMSFWFIIIIINNMLMRNFIRLIIIL